MSMATNLSNLAEEMSVASLQVDGQVEEPTQGAKDLWESEEDDSSPSLSPLWSPARRPPSGFPNMKYFLEIQVTLTEELGSIPPPSHSWMAPLVEDIMQEARAGFSKAVVIGPGRTILFYGRHSLGEGLKADEARDAAFLLTGAGTWVGKSAYLITNPMTIPKGKRAIVQAVSANRVKARGPGCPRVNLLAQQPFQFNAQRVSPLKDVSGDSSFDNPQLPCLPSQGQECNRRQRDQRPQSPRFPLPSPDHSFESDRSSLSMTSLMSSRSDCSDRSRCSRWGRQYCEETPMKINLPIFKDEDAKDAVTYQSWRWDLTVYWHARCRDQTLLPYAIRSLQGYPGELARSSSTDISLDDVLTILDEHYNNVKVLDALNQELFQLWMADKETVLDWGVCLSRHLQILAASFLDHFPPDHVAELKRDHFYGWLLKQLKVMVRQDCRLEHIQITLGPPRRLRKKIHRAIVGLWVPNCWWFVQT